ncbi:hypothetical protein AN958_02074 [Leucoagaricus sp. SymC.cos]|nr:hypothetical protein AN958_02074 [Leucoagaricus sp. SymC.cos]
MSKSYLKLIDIPFLRADGVRTSSQHIEEVMRQSSLCNHFVLVGPTQVVCNSHALDTATVYFEVWDSQRGTRAANLMGHSLQFSHWTIRILEANANPGVSLCQRCWTWGHSSKSCHAKVPRCPLCGSPHY